MYCNDGKVAQMEEAGRKFRGENAREITLHAFRDMVEALAYPHGFLTVKQMRLVKTIGKMLGISENRQKIEFRAAYALLETERMTRGDDTDANFNAQSSKRRRLAEPSENLVNLDDLAEDCVVRRPVALTARESELHAEIYKKFAEQFGTGAKDGEL